MGLPWQELRRLGDLQVKLNKSLEEMIDIVNEVLHQQPYSKEEVLEALGVTSDQLLQTSLSTNTAHGMCTCIYIVGFSDVTSDNMLICDCIANCSL